MIRWESADRFRGREWIITYKWDDNADKYCRQSLRWLVSLNLVIRIASFFTADGLWLRNSSVVAEVFGAEAGPDGAVGVALGALQAALLGHVDGVVGRAEEDALGKALSERTCRRMIQS